MTLTLYTITNDNNYLDKISNATAVTETPITVEPVTPVDILNPSFVLVNNGYVNCNYVYCDTFDRYYYIDNITLDTAGRVVLHCKVDVLQSWKSEILSCFATITRSESIGHPTLYPDKKLPVHPVNKFMTSIVMPETSGSFSSDGEYCYLLTVMGGVVS